MNTIQRITKNVGILFICQVVSYVLGFFTLMYSAQYLGVEGFGTLSLALAFTGIFSVFMDLGLSTLTIREVARDKLLVKDYVANITLIKLILTAITFLAIFIIVHLLGYDQQTLQVIYIITLYTIFTAFSQLFYSVFQAHEKMEYQAIGTIISSVLLMLGVFIAIYFKFNLLSYSLIYFVSGTSIFIYAILSYSKNFSLPKMKFDIIQWKSLIKESWPFAITTISLNIYTYIDTLMLSVMQGYIAVGLYNASYKLVLILVFIPMTFNMAIYPLMSQYYISSKKSLSLTFEKLFKSVMLIALPICIGTVLIANKIIMLIYGTQFLGAVIALQILIWSIVPMFARTTFERLLESTNRQLVITKSFIVGVIFNVILNLIVIPKYGYIGAGLITVLTEVVVLGLLIIAAKNIGLSISKNTKMALPKIIIASLIMGIALNSLIYLNIFALIIIGTIVYILSLFSLNIFDNNEKKMIKSIFKRET